MTRRQTISALVAGTAASVLPVVPQRADIAVASPARTATTPQAVDDVGATSLSALVASVPPESSVTITRDWTVAEPVVLAAPIALRFDGGSISTSAHVSLIRVTASDVRIERPVLRGRDGTVSGLGRGIHAVGTPEAPLRNIEVHGGSITAQSHDGVLLEHVRDFTVDGVTITDVGYAGVLLFSCVDGVVSGNRIAEVHQPTPYVNSYGIEAVRATTAGIDQYPRSARITVSDNWVSGVRSWEGIDTHGGEHIAILRNRVEDCRVGIALVPSKDEADASKTKYAPLSCSVVGNTVTRSFRGAGSGIIVRGAGETVDSPAERATGMVINNTISGFGDADRDGPILVYLTRQLIIAGNDLRGYGRAIAAYHSNTDLTVCRNTVAEVASLGTARSAGIAIVATANTGVVFANQVSAGDVGLQCRAVPNALMSIGNVWDGAGMDPVVSTGDTVARFRDG